MNSSSPADVILVADDDEHIVDLVGMYLRRAGFAVESAYDGDEALRKANELHPALLVLDVMMPGQDGLQICRTLSRRGDTPIVLLTARSTDIDKIAGLRLGADDYVTKPFNPDELVARVEAVLRRTRSQRWPAPGRARNRSAASISTSQHAPPLSKVAPRAHTEGVRPPRHVRPLPRRRSRSRAAAGPRLGHILLCDSHRRRPRRPPAR